MLPYLVWSLVFVMTCSTFQYSYLYGGVSRVFAGLRKGVVEAASEYYQFSYHPSSYRINLAILRGIANEYFTINLEPYCKSSDWQCSCYAENAVITIGGHQLTNTNPDICIKLTVDFHSFGKYENQMKFKIVEGLLYGQ